MVSEAKIACYIYIRLPSGQVRLLSGRNGEIYALVARIYLRLDGYVL